MIAYILRSFNTRKFINIYINDEPNSTAERPPYELEVTSTIWALLCLYIYM